MLTWNMNTQLFTDEGTKHKGCTCKDTLSQRETTKSAQMEEGHTIGSKSVVNYDLGKRWC